MVLAAVYILCIVPAVSTALDKPLPMFWNEKWFTSLLPSVFIYVLQEVKSIEISNGYITGA